MNKKSITKLIGQALVPVLLVTMSACSGSGSRSLTAAEAFVSNLNWETDFVTFWLEKDPTLAYGYIIVEESDGTFWAIDITDPTRWSYAFDSDYYYDWAFQVWRDYPGSSYFVDIWGNLYEETTNGTRDMDLALEQVQNALTVSKAATIEKKFGVAQDRALEIARFAMAFESKGDSVTEADAEQFSKDVLGFNIVDAMDDFASYKSGNKKAMDEWAQKAAETNGFNNAEDVLKLIDDNFAR